MRGVPEGMKLHEGMRQMQRLASSVTPAASVVLDPTLFRQYGVKHVPAVVRVKTPTADLACHGRCLAPLIAKVEGLHNDDWLRQQIQAGQTGDLGIQGEVVAIAEQIHCRDARACCANRLGKQKNSRPRNVSGKIDALLSCRRHKKIVCG